MEMVEWILAKMPDANSKRDYKGRTPADLCREVNPADCEVIYYLINGVRKPAAAPVAAPAPAVYHSS